MANALNATLAKRARNGAVLAGSAAAAMAAMALWNTYRARKVEREHPPCGRFVTADGARLHYLEKGRGRPVVLLHGNVVTAEDFELSGLLDLAAERECHVVAFDRPGFGYNDRPHGAMWPPARQADLLRQAFANLGIERPVVVGHIPARFQAGSGCSTSRTPSSASTGRHRSAVVSSQAWLASTIRLARSASAWRGDAGGRGRH